MMVKQAKEITNQNEDKTLGNMRYSYDMQAVTGSQATSDMKGRDLHHTAMDLDRKDEPQLSARNSKKPRL